MRGQIMGGLLATTVVAGLAIAPVDADAIQRDGGTDAIQRDGGTDAIQRDGGTDAIQRDGGTDAIQRDGGVAAIQRGGGTTGAVADPSFGVSARSAAMAAARAGAAKTAAVLRLSAGQSLVVKDVLKDVNGTTHVRYDRTYRGLPVVGGDIVVHRRSTGRIASVDYASRGNLAAVPSVRARVPARVAVSAARRSSGLPHSVARPSLAVWALGRVPRLSWRTEVSGRRAGAPARDVVYVDAVTGRRIQGWSTMETTDAVGTGNSLYDGTVAIHTDHVGASFLLRDLTRGNQATYTMNHQTTGTGTLLTDPDNEWGNGTKTNAQTAAVDAHYGAAITWDYYKNTFGRNGIRADGVGARSRVHYGVNYSNAFWNDGCFCMTYGDGNGSSVRPLVALDVAGHEMSHGVTSNTAGLLYFGESGGINEATSDIFGTMVEFSANNAADPGDYYIGEEVINSSPSWLRRMDNPHLDGQSYNCYTPLMGRDDVHYTSGVANHFYYLLAEGTGPKTIGGLPHNGKTCNGTTIGGTGRTKAERIWYRALTVYMTSGANYRDARDATIRAARDLYGATSGACQAVVRTWTSLLVGPGLWGCAGPLTASGGANKVKNGGFETGKLPWVAPAGVIVSTLPLARTGKGFAYLNGFGRANTQTLKQTLTLPKAQRITLSYYLAVDSAEKLNNAHDALSVQVAKPNGAVATLATFSNAAGDSTYHRRTANLSGLRGKRITLRFVGTENASLVTNFWLDDISIKAG
jgi:Zn-dependent metalloprotease